VPKKSRSRLATAGAGGSRAAVKDWVDTLVVLRPFHGVPAKPLVLGKFSLGVGDRFGRQAVAQLRACQLAADHGVEIIPVWNKSNREHAIIGSEPTAVRAAADRAVQSLGWRKGYHVDADHIGLKTVDRFIDSSDFFTIDVADQIGVAAPEDEIRGFAAGHAELLRPQRIDGLEGVVEISHEMHLQTARRYLRAVRQAGEIYRHIAAKKPDGFIAEISMDETDTPQSWAELLIILAAIAEERIPIQTIAPKFFGRFNKGVDYVGSIPEFEWRFSQFLAVIRHAVAAYDLPQNLKISVHSGSDKFSLYAPIRRALARFDAGLHLKTAGTTWLEEVIGLAESGGDSLALVKEIYAAALDHRAELCAPYATVLDLDPTRLPSAAEVSGWDAVRFVAALRHEPQNPLFNPHLRQLMHVGYKIAAQQGLRYLDALDACREVIARNVTTNLFERHVQPLFLTP